MAIALLLGGSGGRVMGISEVVRRPIDQRARQHLGWLAAWNKRLLSALVVVYRSGEQQQRRTDASHVGERSETVERDAEAERELQEEQRAQQRREQADPHPQAVLKGFLDRRVDRLQHHCCRWARSLGSEVVSDANVAFTLQGAPNSYPKAS